MVKVTPAPPDNIDCHFLEDNCLYEEKERNVGKF